MVSEEIKRESIIEDGTPTFQPKNLDNKSFFGLDPKAFIYDLEDEDETSEEDDQPLQGFGEISSLNKEGPIYLKTKSDKHKEFNCVLAGTDLFFYRRKTDSEHHVMHSLVGTFVKKEESEGEMWSLKIVIPPSKSRLLFFKTQDEQEDWY